MTVDANARRELNEAMTRLARGERDAFDFVYRGLFAAVRALSSKMIGETEADDAAQQTLIKLLAQASDYETGRDVLTWALSIAVWECRTIRRRAGRSREAPFVRGTEVIDPARSPEDAIVAQEAEAAFIEVLGRLSTSDREALEAALEANASSPTLRKRKQRALDRLRKLWRSVYGTD